MFGFGWSRLSAKPPIVLADFLDINPIAASYLGQKRSVLVRTPISKCLHFSMMSFTCSVKSASPFIKTLIEYRDFRGMEYEGSPLEVFYKMCQPNSAAEYIGLNNPSYKALQDIPPAGAPLFWRVENPFLKVERRRKQIKRDNLEHGRKIYADHGDIFYGPVSLEKGKFEFDRLIHIFGEIKNNGFIVDYSGLNNINACSLYSNNQWRYIIHSAGQHRIAALVALGYDDVILQLEPYPLGGVIRRDDAEHWPGVREGYYSCSEALNVFDRMFNGEQPDIAMQWLFNGP